MVRAARAPIGLVRAGRQRQGWRCDPPHPCKSAATQPALRDAGFFLAVAAQPLSCNWLDRPSEIRLDRAEVSTSPSLQKRLSFSQKSFFSISEAGTTCILGAVDEETMRSWVCAILAQKGEKSGGMAVLESETPFPHLPHQFTPDLAARAILIGSCCPYQAASATTPTLTVTIRLAAIL